MVVVMVVVEVIVVVLIVVGGIGGGATEGKGGGGGGGSMANGNPGLLLPLPLVPLLFEVVLLLRGPLCLTVVCCSRRKLL